MALAETRGGVCEPLGIYIEGLQRVPKSKQDKTCSLLMKSKLATRDRREGEQKEQRERGRGRGGVEAG